MRRVLVTCLFATVCAVAPTGRASAEPASYVARFGPVQFGDRVVTMTLPRSVQAPAADPAGQQSAPALVAFEYSDAYRTRAKIHRLASWATLPLFATEAYLGQKMFNNPAQASGATRSAHKMIAVAISGLFAVNTVTGVWNMMEARKDPNGLTLRTIHGVLMLVADAGFFATAVLTRPNNQTTSGLTVYDAKANQHLAMAYASVSVATVGYLIMLFGK